MSSVVNKIIIIATQTLMGTLMLNHYFNKCNNKKNTLTKQSQSSLVLENTRAFKELKLAAALTNTGPWKNGLISVWHFKYFVVCSCSVFLVELHKTGFIPVICELQSWQATGSICWLVHSSEQLLNHLTRRVLQTELHAGRQNLKTLKEICWSGRLW